jgi:P27 family predicted phage terminase small subunit
MKGRPIKPTRLKILDGEPNKDRINYNEPSPVINRPSCPAHLSTPARTEWRRLTKELFDLGLLTNIDRAALAAYCQSYGRWVEAETQLKKLALMNPTTKGLLYKTANDNLIINPLVKIAQNALELMHKYLIEFGMTPASRTRIHAAKAEVSDDPMDKLLNTKTYAN